VLFSQPILRVENRSLEWSIEIPDADVRGQIRWPGGERAIEGRGYRDRVWLDIAPWRLTLRTLRWGRAVSEGHASVWTIAETSDGVVKRGWCDGEPIADPIEPVFEGDRELVAGPIVDLDGLALGPLRPILRRATGNPLQRKWAGRTSLDGARAIGVHEIVTFPERRR
jgi:hypothetical protein